MSLFTGLHRRAAHAWVAGLLAAAALPANAAALLAACTLCSVAGPRIETSPAARLALQVRARDAASATPPTAPSAAPAAAGPRVRAPLGRPSVGVEVDVNAAQDAPDHQRDDRHRERGEHVR